MREEVSRRVVFIPYFRILWYPTMKSFFRLPVPLQVLVPVPLLAHRSKASSAGKHRAQTHIFWKWKREQRQRQWQRIIAIIAKAALHKFKFQFCLSFHESLSNQGRYSSAHCRLYFVIMEQPLSLNSEEREQIIVNCHLWKSESAEKKFFAISQQTSLQEIAPASRLFPRCTVSLSPPPKLSFNWTLKWSDLWWKTLRSRQMQYIVKQQVVLMGLMSFWSMCAHFCCMLAKVTKNNVFFCTKFHPQILRSQ